MISVPDDARRVAGAGSAGGRKWDVRALMIVSDGVGVGGGRGPVRIVALHGGSMEECGGGQISDVEADEPKSKAHATHWDLAPRLRELDAWFRLGRQDSPAPKQTLPAHTRRCARRTRSRVEWLSPLACRLCWKADAACSATSCSWAVPVDGDARRNLSRRPVPPRATCPLGGRRRTRLGHTTSRFNRVGFD